jgi:Holliday junction resolvasome RuvABC ATP-dependent DNA helicase subunit
MKVLEIHKISPKIRNILQLMMSTWRTNLWVNNKNAATVNIRKVICFLQYGFVWL